MRHRFLAAAAFALGGIAASAAALAGPTVDKIRARGELVCGVSQGSAGLSLPDSNGRWSGLDVDYCKALAAAVLGAADKVRFVPVSSAQRFAVLQNGEIDVLSRNTTWTSTRDASLGVSFVGTIFYDGQAFMVPKKLGVTSAKQLGGATVCVQPGTVNEQNLVDYFSANGMKFKSVVIESLPELESAFYAGRCDVYLSDASTLSASRASRAGKVEDFAILPERITKSPLSPVVRADDAQWFAVARWTLNLLIEAEELGVTSANVEAQKQSKNPSVQRLLGVSPGIGKAFGLDESWGARVIASVGNYGEIFDRNLGPATKLGLERGQNALWNKGGLLYSPPFQ
ncbi:amino acid ABC transporter substrate-binding protein [Enterovirga rhinocerotis]|uniref:General L-amino acid transport system substrate-binding protein n=1 Tax=Enterovirga rhinocerotis TaxID=1339210 RepID=A0A4R7C3B9_9HYPH|nr:amino acid ABC transporter substrate-binding protein [Enterovirga rhinocerotis]TDR92970.1 general L-amino acid transport system substrate-binding protein [Enterovirga rhinocerotis]